VSARRASDDDVVALPTDGIAGELVRERPPDRNDGWSDIADHRADHTEPALTQRSPESITSPASLHAHKVPTTFQPLAMELEVEATFLAAARCVARRRPGSPVPEHHCAAAIFALRNRAFEGALGEGMILDMNGEPLVRRIEARAARHCLPFKRHPFRAENRNEAGSPHASG
jgi:hypothetical protein